MCFMADLNLQCFTYWYLVVLEQQCNGPFVIFLGFSKAKEDCHRVKDYTVNMIFAFQFAARYTVAFPQISKREKIEIDY